VNECGMHCCLLFFKCCPPAATPFTSPSRLRRQAAGDRTFAVTSQGTDLQDTVSTPSAHRQDTVRTPSGHRQDTVSTPSGHRQDTVRTPSGHRDRQDTFQRSACRRLVVTCRPSHQPCITELRRDNQKVVRGQSARQGWRRVAKTTFEQTCCKRSHTAAATPFQGGRGRRPTLGWTVSPTAAPPRAPTWGMRRARPRP
jgi:hypothetical protein